MMYGRRRRYNACTLKQREVQAGCKEKSFQHEDSQQQNSFAQRGGAVSILGGFQDPAG